MLGKIFWGMVILLFVAILVIPFLLPSYYASQAEAQYASGEIYESEADSGDGIDIDFKKSRKKSFSKSVRSSGGSRSYRSGK